MTNHPHCSRIKDWASYVRRFRAQHALSQVKLAELLTAGQEAPVYESTIQRWEYGHRIPPPYLKLALERIAEKIKLQNSTNARVENAAVSEP
jgi:ribosome-binding protein aMBF1 (putative translation factor)